MQLAPSGVHLNVGLTGKGKKMLLLSQPRQMRWTKESGEGFQYISSVSTQFI